MRRALASSVGPAFVVAGLLHFIIPKAYMKIMPPYLPRHRELVYASGVAEIAGGLGLMAPPGRIRRAAMWWLLATLVAVFPANIHMALHPEQFPRIPGGRFSLWARLPLQPLIGLAVVRSARRDER
jgi:uncharacterized membrane protein